MGTNFKASIIIRHEMKTYHKSSSLLSVKIFEFSKILIKQTIPLFLVSLVYALPFATCIMPREHT
jgi:hypothetical protein